MSNFTPPPVINPKPKPSKSFGLPEAAGCVALVVVVAIGAVKSSGASFYAASELVGRLIGSMVAAGIVAFVVWLVTRNRAPKAWVWTFAGAMVAIAVVTASFSKAESDAKTKAALSDLKRDVAGARGSAPLGKPGAVDIDRVEKAADDFAAAAGGKDKAMARLSADFIKFMAVIGRSSQEAVQKFQAAGGMDVASINTVSDCEARITAVTQFDMVARANLDRIRRVDAELDRLGAERGVTYEDLQSFKRTVHESARLSSIVRIREIDVELAESFKAYFTLLLNNFNKWKVEEGKVMFSAPGLLPKFNETVVRIQTLSAEQTKLLGEVSQAAP